MKTAEKIIIEKVGEFWWICGKHRPEFINAMEEYKYQFKPDIKDLISFIDDGNVEINFYGNDGSDNQEKVNGKELLKKYIHDAIFDKWHDCSLDQNNKPLVKAAVSNCYADDCLIQSSCSSFKTDRCNKECKLYA